MKEAVDAIKAAAFNAVKNAVKSRVAGVVKSAGDFGAKLLEGLGLGAGDSQGSSKKKRR